MHSSEMTPIHIDGWELLAHFIDGETEVYREEGGTPSSKELQNVYLTHALSHSDLTLSSMRSQERPELRPDSIPVSSTPAPLLSGKAPPWYLQNRRRSPAIERVPF